MQNPCLILNGFSKVNGLALCKDSCQQMNKKITAGDSLKMISIQNENIAAMT